MLKLKLSSVAKRYGNIDALHPISLDVSDGEFLTLLGPSGSGKTTVLNILAGLILPDRGDVWISGTKATHLPPHKRDISLMFQNYALFPHLSVFENIAFPLRMRRVAEPTIRQKVARMLEIVRLPHVAERYPRELSGGQQQRIALARCAVYEPSIILMDEPLGALDKKLRDELQLEIRRLHKDLGSTVVYVTHDQEEAMSMSDRICLMNDGRIEQLGTPEDLYFSPVTLFSAEFLGNANRFRGVVIEVGLDFVVVAAFDGRRIVGRVGGGSILSAGEQVAVIVRPEHMSPQAAEEQDDNAIAATIDQKILLGSVQRYFCSVLGGEVIECQTLTGRPMQAAEGDAIRLTWSRENTLIYSLRDNKAASLERAA